MKNVLKKVSAALLALAMVSTVTACSAKSGSTATTDGSAAKSAKGEKVAVAMPTQSSQRWIQDGANMKSKLEKLGYKVDLQYAEDDVQTQVNQIENMINSGAKCLVVAAIDSSALVNVLAEAKANNIPVIAYDRLLMDTDAVSYYATFNNEGVGTLIGQYIEEKKDLKNAKAQGKSYNIEFFMGSPDDNNAVFFDKGVHKILDPYLQSGVLKCPSGQTDFSKTNTLRWSQETAQKRAEDILSGFYAKGEHLDIVCSVFDGLSYGVKAALTGAGYAPGDKWPLITGQDAEIMAVKNIMNGTQTQTVYKDTRVLADKCVSMVEAVLKGTKPEVNDTTTYNNNKKVVPSYLCTPVAVDKDNYKKILIDGGYYTEDKLK